MLGSNDLFRAMCLLTLLTTAQMLFMYIQCHNFSTEWEWMVLTNFPSFLTKRDICDIFVYSSVHKTTSEKGSSLQIKISSGAI